LSEHSNEKGHFLYSGHYSFKTPIMQLTITPEKEKQKQVKSHISYGKWEAKKILRMEDELMDHFGYNRSQLYKNLIRDACSKISLLWVS